MIRMTTITLVAVCLAACEAGVEHAADAGPDVSFLHMPGMAELDLPFSSAVRVGDTLYVSGAIGYDRESAALVPGGIRPETRKTLENIAATVEAFGSSMDRVVKCTVFLADMSEWGAMNEVYTTFFPNNKPARSALGASGLALGARVEIECIAVVG